MKKGPGTQGSMGLERSIGFVSYTTYHWATKKIKHFKLDLKLAQAKMQSKRGLRGTLDEAPRRKVQQNGSYWLRVIKAFR